MNHDLQNGMAQLQQLRQRDGVNGRRRRPRPLDALLTAPVATAAEPAQSHRELSLAEILRREKLATLDDLTTAHMNSEQATAWNDLLTAVRRWRNGLDGMKTTTAQGRMFVICSDGYGCGKTHIARAVMTSFTDVVRQAAMVDNIAEPYAVFEDGSVNYSIDRRGRMLTARDLWQRLDDGRTLEEIVGVATDLLVLDDVGREPNAQYEKREPEIQAAVRQERYYALLNHCYERTQQGRPINVLLTSNMLFGGLRYFFNDATWSRVQEMAPRGNVHELIGFPDMRLIRSGRAA